MRFSFFSFALGAGVALYLTRNRAATQPTQRRVPGQPPVTTTTAEVPAVRLPTVEALAARADVAASKYLTEAQPYIVEAKNLLAQIAANAAARGQGVPSGMAAPAPNVGAPGGLPTLGAIFGG